MFDSIYNKVKLDMDFRVYQIAVTERSRVCLASEIPPVSYNPVIFSNHCYEDVGLLRKLLWVFGVIKRDRPEIVVVTGYSSSESWLIWFLRMFFRFKLFVAVDSGDYKAQEAWYKRYLKVLFLGGAAKVLAYGDSTVKNLLRLNVDKERIVSPFHCVDKKYYMKIEDVLGRRKVKFDGKVRLLFVGRLAPEKNIKMLLNLFKNEFKSHELISLYIAGDGPLRDSVLECVDSVDNIFYVGPKSVSELIEYYCMCTALVLPSTYEPWGLVANEALCMGASLILSERCGCSSSFVDKSAGVYLFNPLSSDSLVDAISNLIKEASKFDPKLIYANHRLSHTYTPDGCAEVFSSSVYSVLEKS